MSTQQIAEPVEDSRHIGREPTLLEVWLIFSKRWLKQAARGLPECASSHVRGVLFTVGKSAWIPTTAASFQSAEFPISRQDFSIPLSMLHEQKRRGPVVAEQKWRSSLYFSQRFLCHKLKPKSWKFRVRDTGSPKNFHFMKFAFESNIELGNPVGDFPFVTRRWCHAGSLEVPLFFFTEAWWGHSFKYSCWVCVLNPIA